MFADPPGSRDAQRPAPCAGRDQRPHVRQHDRPGRRRGAACARRDPCRKAPAGRHVEHATALVVDAGRVRRSLATASIRSVDVHGEHRSAWSASSTWCGPVLQPRSTAARARAGSAASTQSSKPVPIPSRCWAEWSKSSLNESKHGVVAVTAQARRSGTDASRTRWPRWCSRSAGWHGLPAAGVDRPQDVDRSGRRGSGRTRRTGRPWGLETRPSSPHHAHPVLGRGSGRGSSLAYRESSETIRPSIGRARP